MPKKSEADVRLEVRRWYELQGAFVIDTEQQRADTRVTAGLSDLIVAWPGRGIRFVECKAAHGTQRPSQITFQLAVEAAFGTYLLARSVDECIEFERSVAA